ncbi:hypothetical protein [Flavobacterium psychrotrophum]|uniref:hypothetical protein n=1 Tax=Flavobacterium psychrotrophum TaxID=2294119 RepID=UPI000E320660|nr:hypothetical protein [Flavobacterium psychrotrophum]
MKLKYCFVALLALSSVVSCKIDNGETKPAEAAAPKEEVVATGKVMVTLNAVVAKDDNFQIFYNENGSLDFNGEQTLSVSVIGKPEAQDIRFALPDDSLPTALRLDTGDKDLGQLTVNSLTVNYYEKSLVIKGGDEFLKNFQPNNLVTDKSDATSATFTVKPVKDGSYDPQFYPTGDLINALKGILVK